TPSSLRNDSFATAITCATRTSLLRSRPAVPEAMRRRSGVSVSASLVVGGRTMVEGYPASFSRSSCTTMAGPTFPGLGPPRGVSGEREGAPGRGFSAAGGARLGILAPVGGPDLPDVGPGRVSQLPPFHLTLELLDGEANDTRLGPHAQPFGEPDDATFVVGRH